MGYKFTALIASAKRPIGAILAGVILSVPFWWAIAGWLIIPVVVLYLLWLDQFKPSARLIWLSGASFFAAVMNWMYHIHAIELIPNNVLATGFLILTFTIVVGSLSLGFLAFGWAFNVLRIDLNKPEVLLSVPFLWAVCEWSRSFIFSIVGMGPGGTLGAHWNFGSLAFPGSITPLGFSGRLLGQFGLSALILFVSLGVIFLIRKQWKWGVMSLVLTGLICTTGWAWNTSPQGSAVRVGVVQLDDGSYSDYGYQRDLGHLTSSHDVFKPLDVLVMPEYSYIFTNQAYKQAETTAMQRLFADNKGLVITSRSGEADQGHKNLVTFYQPDGQIAYEQEKQFLIPAGEYLPYFYEWILVLSGNTSVIQGHDAKNKVDSSSQEVQPVAYGTDKLGSLACSGAIAPEFYRDLVGSGATVLTNSAALTTMGISNSYYAQARQMASFLAVANARPFVQSARGAEVFVLDANGRPVVDSKVPGVHYLEADITTNKVKTPYSYLGEVFVIAAGVYIVYTFVSTMYTHVPKAKGTKHKGIDTIS